MSSFVQTMMGRRAKRYTPSFVEIGPPVLDEKIIKYFTIYRRGGHIDHVTWTIYTNFDSPFTRRFHINLRLIGQVVLEEKMFENC